MTKVNELLLSLPANELHWSFSHSSGKGGQNVNKVNSKATLKFNVLDTVVLDDEAKLRAQVLFANRINHEGEIVIASDRYRDQPQNIRDCLEKLNRMLIQAIFPPKARKKTKPTRSSKKRRVESKRRHADKKGERRKKVYLERA